MPRGGRRTGTPGAAYSNRSDLQQNVVPIAAAKGQSYGAAGAQMAAQRALPIAAPPPPATARPAGPTGPAMPSGPMPGQVVPLDAPSQRPGEPVTAGLPVGAGAGPEALGALGGMTDSTGDELRALYARFPTEGLRELIEMLDD